MNLGRIGLLWSLAWSLASTASCTVEGAGPTIDAGAEDSPEADATMEIPTVRVLFIGNSFTGFNDLPHVVARLADAPQSPVRLEVGATTPDGQSWQGHDRDPVVDELIHQGWDYVVLQDQSAQPFWDLPEVKVALLSLDAEIRATSARTVLFMTWARADGGFYEHMRVNSYYMWASEATGALVAPVGRAWERALRDPSVTLHAEDGSHPNVRGSYLAACVFYATLTGESPVGLGDGGLAVSDADAAFLQRVAWDTIVARRAATSPVGRWSLAETEDLVPAGVVFGDAIGPDGDVATRFSPGAYAGVPYFVGMNTPQFTVSLSVEREDWSQPTEHPEHLVGRRGIYAISLEGTTLVAEVTHAAETAHLPVDTRLPIGSDPPPVVTRVAFAAEVLSAGWHRITFTHDGVAERLWIDGENVASVPAAGIAACGAADPGCDSGIVLGAESEILGISSERVPHDAFTGALTDLRVFGTALTAEQIRAL